MGQTIIKPFLLETEVGKVQVTLINGEKARVVNGISVRVDDDPEPLEPLFINGKQYRLYMDLLWNQEMKLWIMPDLPEGYINIPLKRATNVFEKDDSFNAMQDSRIAYREIAEKLLLWSKENQHILDQAHNDWLSGEIGTVINQIHDHVKTLEVLYAKQSDLYKQIRPLKRHVTDGRMMFELCDVDHLTEDQKGTLVNCLNAESFKSNNLVPEHKDDCPELAYIGPKDTYFFVSREGCDFWTPAEKQDGKVPSDAILVPIPAPETAKRWINDARQSKLYYIAWGDKKSTLKLIADPAEITDSSIYTNFVHIDDPQAEKVIIEHWEYHYGWEGNYQDTIKAYIEQVRNAEKENLSEL